MKGRALCFFLLWWGIDRIQAQAAPDMLSFIKIIIRLATGESLAICDESLVYDFRTFGVVTPM
jgi:hypothetical protein